MYEIDAVILRETLLNMSSNGALPQDKALDLYCKIVDVVTDRNNIGFGKEFWKVFELDEGELGRIFALPDVKKEWLIEASGIQSEYQKLLKERLYDPLFHIWHKGLLYKNLLNKLDKVANTQWDKDTPSVISFKDELLSVFLAEETVLWGTDLEWFTGWLIK
jgi:hypothetical protein